jgi:hypothetical protein
VALGGPGILGEGPLLPLGSDNKRYKNKDTMLDAYVQINREVRVRIRVIVRVRVQVRVKVRVRAS